MAAGQLPAQPIYRYRYECPATPAIPLNQVPTPIQIDAQKRRLKAMKLGLANETCTLEQFTDALKYYHTMVARAAEADYGGPSPNTIAALLQQNLQLGLQQMNRAAARIASLEARVAAVEARSYNRDQNGRLRMVPKITADHPDGPHPHGLANQYDVGALPPAGLVPTTIGELRGVNDRQRFRNIYWFYNEECLRVVNNGDMGALVKQVEDFVTKG